MLKSSAHCLLNLSYQSRWNTVDENGKPDLETFMDNSLSVVLCPLDISMDLPIDVLLHILMNKSICNQQCYTEWILSSFLLLMVDAPSLI